MAMRWPKDNIHHVAYTFNPAGGARGTAESAKDLFNRKERKERKERRRGLERNGHDSDETASQWSVGFPQPSLGALCVLSQAY
jgi:hypothetical protein